MMSSSQLTQRTMVILNSPSDWDKWLEIIKTKALGSEIWDFVNPATEKAKLPSLLEPEVPIAKTLLAVNPAL